MSELRTPLELALIERDAEAAAARLAAGDSPMDLNHSGIPVLYDGLRSNSPLLLELLDRAGADWATPYNEGGFTPLIYAALHCELVTVRWLIEHGQSPLQRTPQGVGVMHVSVQRSSPEVARYLYQQGADAFAETVHGESPLLISLRSKQGLDLFRFVLACYEEQGQSLAAKLMACLRCVLESQQPDAVAAAAALLPLAETVPTEGELRAYMSRPEERAFTTPFRSLATTLDSRLSRAVFALLKAERVSRACGPETVEGPQAARWRGHGGL
ncbi:MAG: ankyrin repeat domain-containing protein [Pseudomonadota bacterium]